MYCREKIRRSALLWGGMTIITTRKRVELCPRSYDVLQRAELDNLHALSRRR